MFANHPEFQFGPLSATVALPFAVLPAWLAVPAVVGLCMAMGYLAVTRVEQCVRLLRPDADPDRSRRAALVGAALVLAVWTDVAVRAVHLDDALALAGLACAVATTAQGNSRRATLALAFAAAAKPWALVFAPITLVGAGPRRWLRPVAVLALVGVIWLPFVLVEPRTISALGGFAIRNAAASSLRALGSTAAVTPGWVRPTQLLFGSALVLLLVVTRRWPAAAMTGMAVRIATDPGVHHYYTAGLTLSVLLWERSFRPERIPWCSAVTAGVLELTPSEIQPAAAAGYLRLGLCIGLVGLAALGPRT